MTTPLFQGPDGTYREHLIFSTDRARRFFTGSTDAATADMQVSIRGGGFSSDPEHITFEGTTFTIPNPSAHPEGLQLYPGANVIEVQAILTSGAVTNPAVAEAQLSLDRDVKEGVIAPSGVSVERFDDYVKVSVEGLVDANVKGYNFYASVYPGGGLVGYSQVNPQLVISSETEESTTTLGTLTVDSLISLGPTGAQAVDPLYLQVQGSQVNRAGTLVQLDYTQAMEVPETTRQVKTTVLIEDVLRVQIFSFEHNRNSVITSTSQPAVPNAEFNTIQSSDPLYYVVTAVYVIDGDEYESVFSPEVAAYPLTVTPDIDLLPVVTRQQVVQATVLSIYRSQPQVDVKPGAVLRDTFIDPFSTEAERIRFIVGFLQAGQSFTTLLLIDDPTGTGDSIPVSQSPYKQALKQAFFLQSDDDVQALIDNSFDALAARRGTTRWSGVRSRGEVTAYTTTKPTQNLPLTLGTRVSGGGQYFRFTSSSELTPTGAGSTYNPATGRYAVRIFLQAEEEGSAGNLAPGQITTILNGPAGVSVTNESRTFGGRDLETNRDLAARADGILSAVDSGTYRGYTQDAIEVPGVRQVNVVDAGHGLMLRDWDPTLGRHTGGKVDVWIRGESLSTVTDTFAFAFTMVKRGQFEPVGEVTNLKFRAINASISTSNPIIEMLDYSSYGYEFKDETTGMAFDLTNVTIVGPDTIQLDTTLNDPTGIVVTDMFTGSYRFRTSDNHVFSRQPVRSISSLVGSATGSGTVDPSLYALYAGSDPLDLGRSSEAGDYFKITQPLGTTAATAIPSGTPIAVVGESHVILEGTEYLDNLGTNPLTVRVWNNARTTEYIGPYSSTGTPDFTLVDEDGETPLGILLTSGSQISEGETVLVDYSHDENFVVTYVSNSLVAITQDAINTSKHVTADVLVKEAIQVEVDLTATVVLDTTATASTVDGLIRTALSRLFGGFSLGQPVRQGDIINAIDSVDGVSYPVVPLTKMSKGDGSLVVRETITTDQDSDFVEITDWSSSLVQVYLIKDALGSETIDGGGASNETRGVFLDKAAMTLYDTAPNVNGVPLKNSANGAFIIGNEGLYIPGYSDDATLQALYPFATTAEIDTKRQEITAKRVLVTLPVGTTPKDGDYRVTYVVYSDTGIKNIVPGPVEYLVLGDLEFTKDIDTDFRALVAGRS